MLGLVPRKSELDRLFEDMWRPLDLLSWHGARGFVPTVDVTETENAVEIEAELPGLDQKDVDVTVTGNCLRIKGEKKEERNEDKKNYRLVERSYGSFERHIALPDYVDGEKIEASFDKGILHITVPKAKESRPKKIEIK